MRPLAAPERTGGDTPKPPGDELLEREQSFVKSRRSSARPASTSAAVLPGAAAAAVTADVAVGLTAETVHATLQRAWTEGCSSAERAGQRAGHDVNVRQTTGSLQPELVRFLTYVTHSHGPRKPSCTPCHRSCHFCSLWGEGTL